MAADDLTAILNDVAACAASMADEIAAACIAACPDDEAAAFARLDPVFASLRRQYLDARAVRHSAARDYGSNDPMTEIAMLAEDSAWCAMQARMIELKACKETAGRAGRLAEEARRETLRKERERARSADEAFHAQARLVVRHGGDMAALFVFWLLSEKDRRAVVMFRMPPSASFNLVAA